ncbi:MAG: immunoglobulin-like domain-containing protein, partial [Verrucomicrobiota bacterium]|nr:immunoglobulin-like domain-containing protein [Verrucomicrobiota bacterium]
MTEELNDPQTDSTTEEEEALLESEEQETQLDPKHRTPALANLVAGYALALGFGILLAMGMGEQATDEIVDEEVVTEGETMAAANAAPDEGEIISLVGGGSIPWKLGEQWREPGYAANIDGEDFTSFVEVASFVDVDEPGQHKVVYTVKDPDNGEVLESLERLVTVNEGGFIHGGRVPHTDHLEGQIVD